MPVKYCRCRSCSDFRRKLREYRQYNKWTVANRLLNIMEYMEYIEKLNWDWNFEHGKFVVKL